MRVLRQLQPTNYQPQLPTLTTDLDKMLTTTPSAATTQSILTYKLKLPFESRRNQNNFLADVRFSHQAGENPLRACTQIKRRISTAGTSKRFPKDFFRPEVRDMKAKKQPGLLLKWGTGNRISLQNRKKQYSLNIDLQMTQCSPTINTPKFHEPQIEPEPENQFLPNKMKIVSPFPQISQLKLDSTQEVYKSRRPNFIKKVKRGEFLKTKIQSNRNISHRNCLGADLCSIQSMQ